MFIDMDSLVDIPISYRKNKNAALLKSFEQEEVLNISQVQNYLSIYKRFFSLNESNWNTYFYGTVVKPFSELMNNHEDPCIILATIQHIKYVKEKIRYLNITTYDCNFIFEKYDYYYKILYMYFFLHLVFIFFYSGPVKL